jgi:hypothetical protein
MKKIWMMMAMLLSICMLASCKTDSKEASTYLKTFMALALEDFEEQIEYDHIEEIHYLYCYVLPSDEALGNESRFFDFAIRYEDEYQELRFDLFRVHQEIGEDPSVYDALGGEIYRDYTSNQMKELFDLRQANYSVVKPLAIKFIIERGYIDHYKISVFLNR